MITLANVDCFIIILTRGVFFFQLLKVQEQADNRHICNRNFIWTSQHYW